MDAWLPLASYPCGDFSDTSGFNILKTQRIVRPRFHVPDWYWQPRIWQAFALTRHVWFLFTLSSPWGHLRYGLAGMPPQPNSPP